MGSGWYGKHGLCEYPFTRTLQCGNSLDHTSSAYLDCFNPMIHIQHEVSFILEN